MNAERHREFTHRLHIHATKGGKAHRKRQIQRVHIIIRWCGVHPDSIGKAHIHRFYTAHCRTPTTARDYYYAARLLWAALGRQGDPPKPPKPETDKGYIWLGPETQKD